MHHALVIGPRSAPLDRLLNRLCRAGYDSLATAGDSESAWRSLRRRRPELLVVVAGEKLPARPDELCVLSDASGAPVLFTRNADARALECLGERERDPGPFKEVPEFLTRPVRRTNAPLAAA